MLRATRSCYISPSRHVQAGDIDKTEHEECEGNDGCRHALRRTDVPFTELRPGLTPCAPSPARFERLTFEASCRCNSAGMSRGEECCGQRRQTHNVLSNRVRILGEARYRVPPELRRSNLVYTDILHENGWKKSIKPIPFSVSAVCGQETVSATACPALHYSQFRTVRAMEQASSLRWRNTRRIQQRMRLGGENAVNGITKRSNPRSQCPRMIMRSRQ